MKEESFQKLLNFARAGATIIVYKNMPSDVPGWSDLSNRKTAFQKMLSQLSFKDEGKMKKAVVGKGAFIVAEELSELLTAANVHNETMCDKGLSFIRRTGMGAVAGH